MSKEVARYLGPDETKPTMEDMNRSIEEEMIRKTRDNVFVNVAVQQSVVPDRVEDAICKLSNVHAQVDSYVSDVVRLHVSMMTPDETFGKKKDEFSDAVLVQLASNMAAHGFQIQTEFFLPSTGMIGNPRI